MIIQTKDRYFLIIIALCFLALGIPRIFYPDLDHGEDWADAGVLNAAENFARYGFLKYRFLPIEGFWNPDKLFVYTHMPPLAHIFYGILRVLFNIKSLYVFRGVALVFSFFNVFFWYLFIKRFSGSSGFALLASLFYLTNPFFIYGIDALNQINPSDVVRSAIFLLFFGMVLAPASQRQRYVKIIWLLFFIGSWLTFEYIIYFFVFFVLFRFFFKEAREAVSWKLIFFLSTAPILALVMHFLQNAWYFGSLTLAFQDFKTIGLQRIMSSTDLPMPLTFSNWWKFVLLRNISLIMMFNSYLLISAIAASIFIYLNVLPSYRLLLRRIFVLGIIFFISGITWYVFFPAHSLAHTFIMYLVHHLLPLAAVSFAIFIYLLYAFIKTQGENLFKVAFVLAATIFIMVNGVLQSGLPVTRDAINSAKDFLVLKRCLFELKARLGDRDEIGSNFYRHFFIAYYLKRSCILVANKKMLLDLPNPPRFFIFLPYAHLPAQELAKAISENYKILFSCNSRRFPFLIFELRQ